MGLDYLHSMFHAIVKHVKKNSTVPLKIFIFQTEKSLFHLWIIRKEVIYMFMSNWRTHQSEEKFHQWYLKFVISASFYWVSKA